MAVSFHLMWGFGWTRKRCADLRSEDLDTCVVEVGKEMRDGALWAGFGDDLMNHDMCA